MARLSKKRRFYDERGSAEKRPIQDPSVIYVNTIDDTTETVSARNESQRKFIETVRKYDLTVCTGPAGTGKSFLSIAMALRELRDGNVNKIILTRPVVEAGEKLGFLPGDLQEKINPYLRPLYDALGFLLGPDQYKQMIAREEIEISPIAYMRGRTFENAYIIVDEAQNTTLEQIIMVATRLGEGSKMVINGDITQIDLPKSRESGLILFQDILKKLPNVGQYTFTDADVVRHPLVRDLVKAYEEWKKEAVDIAKKKK